MLGPALSVLGPGALCVGPRRSLCGALCVGTLSFLSGPSALCVGPQCGALSVSGLALSVPVCRSLCQAPALGTLLPLSVSDPGISRSLCRSSDPRVHGPLRSACHPSGHRSACHPSDPRATHRVPPTLAEEVARGCKTGWVAFPFSRR